MESEVSILCEFAREIWLIAPMPKFEVHIPASEPGGFNMTLKVGADNWMAALKAGMQKLGEQGTVSQNVMVDIQDDNSIHVTEAHSGRVFRIRELSDDEAAAAQVKRPSQIRPAPRPAQASTEPPAAKTLIGYAPVDDSANAKTLAPTSAPSFDTTKTLPGGVPGVTEPAPPPRTGKGSGPLSPAQGAPTAAARRPHKTTQRVEVPDVEELVQPVKPVTGSIGRVKSSPSVLGSQRISTEDLLADVFLRVVELDRIDTVEGAMEFILELAMEKVPCESGSVFRADGATGDLTFITARGPRAKQVLASNIVIPAGTGIAGFCSSEGVSVAVNDVEKDPRFYSGVGEKVDYETKSLLCAPMMTHGRSFGCMQLINRKGSPQFQEHEVGVLAYLAHQGALYLNTKLLE